MPCPRIIFQACAARFKCFWLCLVLAQLYDPHRPLMQRKTNSQTNGDPDAFLKEVLLLSNVEHVTASIGSMQCAWACIKYRNAISYWSEVRHAWYVYECKTLSLRELVPSCAPGSFSVILVRFTCIAIWVPCHAVGCTRLHWNMMRSMRQLLPAQSENERLLYVNLLVIPKYFFKQV